MIIQISDLHLRILISIMTFAVLAFSLVLIKGLCKYVIPEIVNRYKSWKCAKDYRNQKFETSIRTAAFQDVMKYLNGFAVCEVCGNMFEKKYGKQLPTTYEPLPVIMVSTWVGNIDPSKNNGPEKQVKAVEHWRCQTHTPKEKKNASN